MQFFWYTGPMVWDHHGHTTGPNLIDGLISGITFKTSGVFSYTMNSIVLYRGNSIRIGWGWIHSSCHYNSCRRGNFKNFNAFSLEWLFSCLGILLQSYRVFRPQDVAARIMSFSQQGPRGICILSANGAISNVTLRQPSTSGGTVTYEVHCWRKLWPKYHTRFLLK